MNKIEEDIEQAEWWKRGESKNSMTLEEISTLAKKGFTYCEDYCSSKRNCGEDACKCIRSTFPSPAYYELYKEARSFFLHKLAEGALIAIASSERARNSDGDNNERH